MLDVLIAMAPAMVMAVLVFHWYAVIQVGMCVLVCLGTETVCAWVRGRRTPIADFSAAVTGVILGLSLPWSAPWYVSVLGSVTAIGLGKVVFGGLGHNLFNPAMVGRAFVMLSFASQMGASAYVAESADSDLLTQATPLSIAKQFASDLANGRITAGEARIQLESAESIWSLLVGYTNGSLGETSALALAIGGIFLCVRRSAAWQIPAGVFLAALVFVELSFWTDLTLLKPLRHLISGSLLFGAFFIATDPVGSPLTPLGKFIFGLGVGFLVVLIRVASGYPEGVMFAVLLMNAVSPLLNRWTIPRPLGSATRSG